MRSDSGAGDLGDRSADLITRYRLWPEPGFDYVSPSADELLGYPAKAFYADPGLLDELLDDPAEVEQLHGIYEGEERREPLLLRVGTATAARSCSSTVSAACATARAGSSRSKPSRGT